MSYDNAETLSRISDSLERIAEAAEASTLVNASEKIDPSNGRLLERIEGRMFEYLEDILFEEVE